MNKKIIAAAVVSAMAAPGIANAGGMTVYGHGQVEIGSWGGDASGGTSLDDQARGRIGFKGSQDLGGGLKGLFKAEYKTDFADGDAGNVGCSVTTAGETCTTSSNGVSLQKREMFVGLKGNFGQFEAGRLKSAYKYYGGVKYDPFVATNLEARGKGGMSGGAFGHNSFLSDNIAYENKWGMVKLRLTYDVDDGGGDGNGTDPGGAQGYSAGIGFGSKVWEVILATVSDDDQGTTAGVSDEYTASKVGGKLNLGKMHTIHAQYETVDDGGTDGEYIYLNYSLKFAGKNSLHVSYGTFDEDGGDANDEDWIRLAYMYKFSKKVRVWAGYRETDRNTENATGGTASDVDVVSLGLRVDI